MSKGRETPDSSGVGPGPRPGNAVSRPRGLRAEHGRVGLNELGSAGLVNALREDLRVSGGNGRRKTSSLVRPGLWGGTTLEMKEV
ncbi:MAG TPA: hypothetical protein VFZ06_03915 [Acidimicrobiia bacterium]|nr:hypothetical protein [Acidimicrobiia bacterium]